VAAAIVTPGRRAPSILAKVFVRESDLFRVDSIVRQQKPPRTSLVDGVHSVACGKLFPSIFT